MTSLFDTPPDGEKKRSIFDSQWTNPEAEGETVLSTRVTLLAPMVFAGGILSLLQLAFAHYVLTALSILTLVLGGIAYWQIARSEGILVGKRLVTAGLGLTLLSITATPVSNLFFNYCKIRQARIFAQLVIDAAQKGDTTALELLRHSNNSRPEVKDEKIYWQSVISNAKDNHDALHKELLEQPILLTLYALGDRAKVRFFRSLDPMFYTENEISFPLVYSATYDGTDGKPETFLFFIELGHFKSNEKTGQWCWHAISDKTLEPPK